MKQTVVPLEKCTTTNNRYKNLLTYNRVIQWLTVSMLSAYSDVSAVQVS